MPYRVLPGKMLGVQSNPCHLAVFSGPREALALPVAGFATPVRTFDCFVKAQFSGAMQLHTLWREIGAGQSFVYFNNRSNLLCTD
jgi:hypothetical protein